MLFTTNVGAILASGIVVMALYRSAAPHSAAAPAARYRGAVAIIAALLLAIIVPLTISSNRIDKTISGKATCRPWPSTGPVAQAGR